MPRTRSIAAALLLAVATFANGQTKPAAASAATDEFLGEVAKHFAAWDSDGSGDLSREELDARVADPKTTGKSAAAVAALKRASRSTRYNLPPLTLDNIRVLAAKAPAAATPPPGEGAEDRVNDDVEPARVAQATTRTSAPNLPRLYSDGLTRLGKADRTLFATTQPSLESFHQGRIGDCFCLAPLAAVIARDPEDIRRLIKTLPDGNYEVTLGTKAFTVTPPTDAELAITSTNPGGGMWVNVYEKAVGALRLVERPTSRPTSVIDSAARGGSAGSMLSVITNRPIERFSCKLATDPKLSEGERAANLARLRKLLTSAVNERRLMTCGTTRTTTPGITPNHAYAVLSYDESADTIKLWNPHGSSFTPKGEPGLKTGYPMSKGVITIPLTDFVQQFSGLAFELKEAAAEPAVGS